jgi:hypothetical protein
MGWLGAGHGGGKQSDGAQGLFLVAMVGADSGGAALVGHRRWREGAPTGDPWCLGLAGPDLSG